MDGGIVRSSPKGMFSQPGVGPAGESFHLLAGPTLGWGGKTNSNPEGVGDWAAGLIPQVPFIKIGLKFLEQVTQFVLDRLNFWRKFPDKD